MPAPLPPGNHHRGVDPRSSSPAARFTRRRALGISGLLGLTGVLAACGSEPGEAATSGSSTPAPASGSVDDRLVAMLDSAPRCTLTAEETQGPYWFDVDSIRRDVREDREGMPMELALRVQDVSECTDDPAAGAVANAVVEIWHCDATGVYSGFSGGPGSGRGGSPGGGAPGGAEAPEGAPPRGEAPSGPPPDGAPPAGGPPDGGPGGEPPGGGPGDGPAPGGGGSGETSDGSYSVGDSESTPSDSATYLRGAQVTDSNGIVRFTSVYPGWYTGRAVHVHIKVHIDKKTVLTTQLFFDDDLTDSVYAGTAPYNRRGARDTRNDKDSIYDPSGLSSSTESDGTMLTALNLGIDV